MSEERVEEALAALPQVRLWRSADRGTYAHVDDVVALFRWGADNGEPLAALMYRRGLELLMTYFAEHTTAVDPRMAVYDLAAPPAPGSEERAS